jgi:hypothetical protein
MAAEKRMWACRGVSEGEGCVLSRVLGVRVSRWCRMILGLS